MMLRDNVVHQHSDIQDGLEKKQKEKAMQGNTSTALAGGVHTVPASSHG